MRPADRERELHALRAWQQAMAEALLQTREEQARARLAPCFGTAETELQRTWALGLRIYRSNAVATAKKALAAAYPVLEAMVGEDCFAHLAETLWRRYPPTRGDLGVWGRELALVLEDIPELLADAPYLSDLARLEWSIHEAERAADVADPGPHSLRLMLEQAPERLEFVWAPGLSVLDSRWPIAALHRLHAGGRRPEASELHEVAVRIRAPMPGSVLVWRRDGHARCREIDPSSRQLILAARAGSSLAGALADCPEIDFTAWLQEAITEHYLLGVRECAVLVPIEQRSAT